MLALLVIGNLAPLVERNLDENPIAMDDRREVAAGLLLRRGTYIIQGLRLLHNVEFHQGPSVVLENGKGDPIPYLRILIDMAHDAWALI